MYAAAGYLDTAVEKTLGLQIPFDVYFQDPLVAAQEPELAFDRDFTVQWEPGLGDGPTSARFAVVDYNGDTGRLAAPAVWSEERQTYLHDGKALGRRNSDLPQFHQLNVWAHLQRALSYFESGFGLGRRIPWGFPGNRLIVVPHAGYGENAFYDRRSKSLQFYYFDRGADRIFTCLSTDIINHEFGHAILDGIRPYYSEGGGVETAAFHEFIGDLTAILIILRNNSFRRKLAGQTGGNLSKAEQLSSIAEQFGQETRGRPFLRTALNSETMSSVAGDPRPHRLSQVLTGAMFEVLCEFAVHYAEERSMSPAAAFWSAIQRMQGVALQPLDLLPPADVTFKDYARAVLRAEQLANPIDPYGRYQKMLEVFRRREILTAAEAEELGEPRYLYDRLNLSVYHDISSISRSRSAAYRFLHDNRRELFIPANCDFYVTDLYSADKLSRQAQRLPRQIVLEYLWREDVALSGSQFGSYDGKLTDLLCGGTLALDDKGNVLSWARKPGVQPIEGTNRQEAQEIAEGERRRAALLGSIAQQVRQGQVALAAAERGGLPVRRMAPLLAHTTDRTVRFERSPHLNLGEDAEDTGGRQWDLSF